MPGPEWSVHARTNTHTRMPFHTRTHLKVSTAAARPCASPLTVPVSVLRHHLGTNVNGDIHVN